MVDQPHHGGRLYQAAKRWGIAPEDWLDLSTGINPLGWPVPAVPEAVWQRLPDPDDGLDDVLHHWTGASQGARCLPVAGSQAAIMALPALRPPCRVGVPTPGYQEHSFGWQRLDHRVEGIAVERMQGDDERWLDDLDVLVCINPNNPTGDVFPVQRLLSWHQRLQRRGGWLVVDEAFIEGSHGESLTPYADRPGLIVLRSLGKFFGLAGLRAGAVITCPAIARPLGDALGPWSVNGPARYLMAQALADQSWQQAARQRLAQQSDRLHQLLLDAGLPCSSGTLLFRYCQFSQAAVVADALAARGILVRAFNEPPALRFGLPGAESDWQKLQQGLLEVTKQIDHPHPG